MKGGPPGMDYFNSQTIFFCGIIVGISLTIAAYMCIKELHH